MAIVSKKETKSLHYIQGLHVSTWINNELENKMYFLLQHFYFIAVGMNV